MRNLFFAAALFVAACATTGGAKHPVNVASVRSEINGTIRSQQNDRTVTSMGHVDDGKAIVYTTNKTTGERQEETWTKDGAGWKLQSSTKLAGEGDSKPNG